MVHVGNGGGSLSPSFVEHIDKCLDCRACETACPSGVEYGKLVEYSRAKIAKEYKRPFFSVLKRRIVYRRLLPYPRRIAAVARLLRFYQRSGLRTLARKGGFLRTLGMAEREQLLPRIDRRFFFEKFGRIFPAAGERRARVALFAGCIANVTFTALNEATVRVLTANGCEVAVPQAQFCCGALAWHAGEREAARKLARKNLSAFLAEDFDAIVTNAAGCGSMLKEYGRLFEETEPEFERADALAKKVRDVTEFLAQLGLSAQLRSFPYRVTYQDSCHLLHGQKVGEAPRTLLRAIPELEFIDLPYSDICCGSAGVYNVTQTGTSLELLAEKMHHAKGTGAGIIATANPGCILQLRAGAEMHETGQEVLHVVELLNRVIE